MFMKKNIALYSFLALAICMMLIFLYIRMNVFQQSGNSYNVKNFGAEGDNLTDDTKAIQSAKNKAAGNDGTYLFAQSHYPGQHANRMVVSDKVPMKALSFDLKDVKLLESPFLENQIAESRWLLSIDNNRLLHTFRLNAAFPPKPKPWEVGKNPLLNFGVIPPGMYYPDYH